MIELKTEAEIARMRAAGRLVAGILGELRPMVRPGTNLLEIEQRARELIAAGGGVSCYWDYAPAFGNGPFRNVICLSLNDAVLHGLPYDVKLRDGDLLSLDLAVELDGWVGDSAISVIAGTPRDEDVRLIKATEEALDAGIAAARPGNRLGDVSFAIAEVARAHGYTPNAEFGGHSVGRTMHEGGLSVPNIGRPHRGFPLRPGLTFAVEPWFAAGTSRIVYDPDGWTIRSADGSRTAHSEHTIAITPDGAQILTAP
ncbi:type I methionyl aminopeptidase [Jiangella anatolica]|uniref:Methionine aminopeptidase n=1 Tax=Jiangella anatolica TaxID=2670374 RepID=A0A2W2CBU8_9ACTN|nr:type I methionyl aminopeptidase [Jiangella anatolica]PZF85757.1 type I methionyl aminopeptidase [Jiangella anatolica]